MRSNVTGTAEIATSHRAELVRIGAELQSHAQYYIALATFSFTLLCCFAGGLFILMYLFGCKRMQNFLLENTLRENSAPSMTSSYVHDRVAATARPRGRHQARVGSSQNLDSQPRSSSLSSPSGLVIATATLRRETEPSEDRSLDESCPGPLDIRQTRNGEIGEVN